jgi:hypothetical protein
MRTDRRDEANCHFSQLCEKRLKITGLINGNCTYESRSSDRTTLQIRHALGELGLWHHKLRVCVLPFGGMLTDVDGINYCLRISVVAGHESTHQVLVTH